MTTEQQPWGRFASLALGFTVMIAGQIIALVALMLWTGQSLSQLADFDSDGASVTMIILVSTPIEIALLALWARQRSDNVVSYLGLVMPRRSDVLFGLLAVVALIVAADTVSWLFGRDLVTSFQNDIYRTSTSVGAMVLLWLAVIVVAPAGEEVLFRGFLFRGWLRSARDTWPAIIVTGALFALLHVQYDWFVIGQVFLFGLLLGFMRWASGSTLLTILLHATINFEGMLETWMGFHG